MTGTPAANGTSANYSAGAPGQIGYFYIAGTAGQSLGLGITNVRDYAVFRHFLQRAHL